MTPTEKYIKLVDLLLIRPDNTKGYYNTKNNSIVLYNQDCSTVAIGALKYLIETVTTTYRIYIKDPGQKRSTIYILDIEK